MKLPPRRNQWESKILLEAEFLEDLNSPDTGYLFRKEYIELAANCSFSFHLLISLNSVQQLKSSIWQSQNYQKKYFIS